MGFLRSLYRTSRLAKAAPMAADVIRTIESLEGDRRYADALAYADEHAARLDERALWAHLGRLRMAAVAETMATSTPRAAWPPDLPDPFPGLVGIPEIDAQDLDWRLVGGAVLHHGSLLVRNMLDDQTAARLSDGIDEVLAAYDAWQDKPDRGDAAADYLPLDLPENEPLANTRPWSRESGGVWAADAPRLFQNMLGIYRDRLLIEAVAGYLGERPLLSVGKTVFRRAEPDGQGLFHQDGAFMGSDIRTLNIWTALSDCGRDAPGLEVVARRVSHIVDTGTPGAIFDWSVARDEAERVAEGAPIVFPQFRAGDSLIFDQLMLHATGVTPGMTKRRYALESWFFAPSSHPADQIPLVI